MKDLSETRHQSRGKLTRIKSRKGQKHTQLDNVLTSKQLIKDSVI